MSTNDAAERVRVLLVDAYWRNVDVGAAKAGALLDAALAEAEARGRAKGLEEAEAAIIAAFAADEDVAAVDVVRALAQPTPDDGDGAPI